MEAPEDQAEIEVEDFSSFFLVNYADIVQSVAWITNDLDQAREISQEAFARLYVRWNKVKRYEFPVAWVRKVAIRLVNRARKLQWREVHIESPERSTRSAEVAGVVLDVRNAIAALPTKQKTAVLLHYFYDLPIKEVGNEMGCRTSTAKVHLHRARESLRQNLRDYK